MYKRNDVYYFSKRINGTPYKVSLHSNNLEYSRILRDRIIEELSVMASEKNEFLALKKFLQNSEHFLVDAKIDLGKARRKIFDVISKKDYERVKRDADELNKARQGLESLTQKATDNTTSDIKNLADKVAQMEANLLAKINSIESNSFKDNQAQTYASQHNDSKIDIYSNIEQYFNEYIEYKKTFDKVSNSSVKTYKASFKYLRYFITAETDFSFKFFKELQKKFQQLPKNFFKYPKYHEKSFDELMKLKEQEDYETLDNKTLNGHINNFRLFFDFLKYEEVISENPLNDIKPLIEAKGTVKEEYTDEELSQIFNSDMEKEYIHMAKVALYCGLRIEEVLSLKKEDIKDDMIFIDLEDTGTKKHQRIIPIHKNLKDTIQFQSKHNKGKYLFFLGNVGDQVKNVGKRMNRRLKKIVNVKEKSFHSFRKNFSQELELNTTAEEKTKKYLMGHSQAKDITHMIYNRGKVNTQKLIECIDQITFNY